MADDVVALEFEKPIAELEIKIEELRSCAATEHMDLSEEIRTLEEKCEELKRQIYGGLTPWQRVMIARHPQRAYTLDYIKALCTGFIELHGDRTFSDDAALVGGLAFFEERPVVVIGHQKGRTVQESMQRNFGMPHPEGYRKALRLMKLAEKFKRPVLCFIDTPGAYPGIGAEERGQARAIAVNLMEMAALKTPLLCTVIGEGGSGGALEAATALKLTAADLKNLGIVDQIIPEVQGGLHRNPAPTIEALRSALLKNLDLLQSLPTEELLESRYQKFRSLGVWRDTESEKVSRRRPSKVKSA
jgi:acetyl-CoA carboxylase carboxyl transferase subunit alpha